MYDWEVKVGDYVRSFDDSSGQYATGRVTKVYNHQTDRYILLNGQTKVTPNHRFYVPRTDSIGLVKVNLSSTDRLSSLEPNPDLARGEWIEIGALKPGAILLDQNGQLQPVKSIEPVKAKSEVFNFEVAPYKNYIANGYVVHNRKLHYVQDER